MEERIKMQEGYTDWHTEGGVGCCLNCSKSYQGCLCYDCKCKKCYWYFKDLYDSKGYCELGPILREKKKQELIKYYKQQKEKEFKKGELLKKQNEQIVKEIKEEGDVINNYTCQGCGRNFITKEYKIINLGKNPLCDICLGKIKID